LYGAVNRLSRLNQSLLLLVKIENRLLKDDQQVDLHVLTKEMLTQFEEIFQDKGIKVSYHLDEKQIYASRYLIEILLNNLFSNAIRHNQPGGEIKVSLTPQSLTVKNTGETTALQEEQIFTRFHKSSHSEGSGLGLTISRQICESFNLSLNYSFQAPYHIFTVSF
jgi:signal transduction histidine kinase